MSRIFFSFSFQTQLAQEILEWPCLAAFSLRPADLQTAD